MPKKHYEPEILARVDGVTVWHTYKEGCGAESDKRLGWHYTLDQEQAEPGTGNDHHFDVRDLPMFSRISEIEERDDDSPPRRWELGHHAVVILTQLISDPSKIPLGEDWRPEE